MPALTELEAKVNRFLNTIKLLSEENPVQGTDLQSKLLSAYQAQVLADLPLILNEQDCDILLNSIKDYLKRNWSLIMKGPLSYTAIPGHKITLLLCDLAQFVQDNTNDPQGEDYSAIKILMSTVSIESQRDTKEYPPLHTLDVKEVIKTHILGREGTYLIPVRQFIELQEEPSKLKWYNIYFNMDSHKEDELALLKQEEVDRLATHSPYTKALFEAKKDYELSLKAQGGLLFHLRQLIRHLYFNSTDGIGAEEDAGLGVYHPIFEFNGFYQKLDEKTKEQIPPEVKEQIDILLMLSDDKNKNSNATENLDTCIRTRRKKLEAAINLGTNETILKQLGLTEASLQTLADEKKLHWDKCKKEFEQAFMEHRYTGADALSLNRSLLKALRVPCSVSSINDLNELLKLNPNELEDLFQDPQIQQNIIDQFKDIETFVLFIHELPNSKLELFLSYFGMKLAKKLIEEPKDLSSLLISFENDLERCQVLCKFIKGALPDFSAFNLFHAFQPLSLEERSIVLETIKEKLPELIQNGYDFQLILSALSTEPQKIILFESVFEKLPGFINSPDQLGYLLSSIPKQLNAPLFETLKAGLSGFINDARDFVIVFLSLSENQRTYLFSTLREALPALISVEGGFCEALEPLPEEPVTALFEVMKNYLNEIIKGPTNLLATLKPFLPKQRTEVLETVKESLPKLITNAQSFCAFYSLDEGHSVFDAMRHKFPELIKDVRGFCEVLKLLDSEQKRFVCEVMKEKMPELIQDVFSFYDVLQPFTPEERSAVFEGIKQKLPEILYDVEDFCSALRALPQALYPAALEAMKTKLPELIEVAYHLETALEFLPPTNHELFLEIIKEKLPHIIKEEEAELSSDTIKKATHCYARFFKTPPVSNTSPDAVLLTPYQN